LHPPEEAIPEPKPPTTTGEKWAFTFGFGTPYRNNFVVFTGSFSEARHKMFDYFGKDWAMQYEWEEFQEQIPRYGLTELQPSHQEPGEEE